MIRFSFIIPVYNAEKTIERCVNSIELNNCSDTEIILIDDCSSDNSFAVCNRLADQYENVICLHNDKNRGVSYTRNRGLQQAKGEYLLFTDSDDWLDSDYIDHFRRIADNYTVDLAVCGYVNHDERQNGRADKFCWTDFEGTKQIDLKSELRSLYDSRLLQQLWNKMFVAKYVKENHIRFDESISIGEDTRFILTYLKYCDFSKTILVNQTPYHYMRDQDGSLMFHIGYESVEEPLKNLRLLYALQGMSEREIECKLAADRERQTASYAYLICHNISMKKSEKKRLVYALDEAQGKKLYKANMKLYYKEKLAMLMKAIKKH